MNNHDIAILERIAVDVTPEQLKRCHKVFDYQTKQNIVIVQNSRGVIDAEGNIIEYIVRYSKQYGFTCTCLAGRYGFANCPNFCHHVRAAVALTLEEVKSLAEIAEREQQEQRAAKPIEVKWNIPSWMLQAPVAPHMKLATKER